MADLKYNFVDNNFFSVYKSPEVLSIDFRELLPLLDNYDSYDLSNFEKTLYNGTPIVKDTRKPLMVVNNNEEIPQQQTTNSISLVKIKSTKGSQALSKLIDEVSKESGFEGLKNPEVKRSIMLQALRESGYNSGVTNKSSTAAGYFQFIDSTRERYSNISRDKFLNDPKEQIRTAFKYYKDIHNMADAKLLKARGYNNDIITALGWWYPKSMRKVLNGDKDFALGGYSIKQAMLDYG